MSFPAKQETQAMIPLDQIDRMAVAFAKSGLFGIKTPEQGVALMLIAQAEGMHPAIAARDYHIIQGRPALKSDAMLARFQAAGGKVVWNAYTDAAVSGTFTHPQGGSATVEWTIQQAKAAGLTNKDVWKQYPRAMLRARVISEGIRTVYPGVSVGVYTPEEIEDFGSKPEIKEVKAEAEPAKPVAAKHAAKPKMDDERKKLLAEIGNSVWSAEQLKTYALKAFKVKSSDEMSIEGLRLLAGIVTYSNFDAAMFELHAAEVANADDVL
jgi:hypothetical protein